jgi:hypothetical protein
MLAVPFSSYAASSAKAAVPETKGMDLSFPKAVAELRDFNGIAYDIDDRVFTGLLAVTGTEIVWRAWLATPGDPESMDDGRFSQFRDRFVDRISYVKTRLPWVLFEGAVDAYDFCPWSGVPDPDAIYNPGSSGYKMGFSGCWPLDIAKPRARQYVIADAESMIDAGVDLLHFDCVDCLAGAYDLNVQRYVDAWEQIAHDVREYARSHDKEVLLTVNTPIGRDGTLWHAFPDQDYFDLSIPPPNIVTNTITLGHTGINWSSIKRQIIHSGYAHLPPLNLFIDYGDPDAETALEALARLPVAKQVSAVSIFFNEASQEQVNFVFPLHSGEIDSSSNPPGYTAYDAIKQGTYDAMRQMMNSISTVHTMTVTSISTQLSTVTTTRNITVSSASQFDQSQALSLSAAIVVAAVVIAIALTAKRRSKREGNKTSF